jgi:hypothetical protein
MKYCWKSEFAQFSCWLLAFGQEPTANNRLPVTACLPADRVTGYWLPFTGYWLPFTGYRLPAGRQGYRLLVTGYRLLVTVHTPSSFKHFLILASILSVRYETSDRINLSPVMFS